MAIFYYACPKCKTTAYWNANKQICNKPSCTYTTNREKLNTVDVGESAPLPTVSWIGRRWHWLNGKKAVIGSVVSGLGRIMENGDVPYAGIVTIIGDFLLYGGVTHKAGKVLNKVTTGTSINWKELFVTIVNFIKKLFKRS